MWFFLSQWTWYNFSQCCDCCIDVLSLLCMYRECVSRERFRIGSRLSTWTGIVIGGLLFTITSIMRFFLHCRKIANVLGKPVNRLAPHSIRIYIYVYICIYTSEESFARRLVNTRLIGSSSYRVILMVTSGLIIFQCFFFPFILATS